MDCQMRGGDPLASSTAKRVLISGAVVRSLKQLVIEMYSIKKDQAVHYRDSE